VRISTDILMGAIRTLRHRVAETEGEPISQEEMARRVGCTLAGYRKWEAGTAIPRGEWMLRILALCPDEETRKNFLDIGNVASKIAFISRPEVPKEEKEAPRQSGIGAGGKRTSPHWKFRPKGT
jgi:predicted transcriptional regulator